MAAANSIFVRPKCSTTTSPNLYVANCGPTVGVSLDTISSVFSAFGRVTGVHAADGNGARVIVCFSDSTAAQAAYQALNGNPCPQLRGRTLRIRFSLPKLPAKTRNVDTRQYLGDLPSFVSLALDKISSFSKPDDNKCRLMDQLTSYCFWWHINEYASGVGLSPRIDTHSAFGELIFSLSIAGPCIMEFRKYPQGTWHPPGGTTADMEGVNFIGKAIFLLFMSGEGRYAWHHYTPHHKVDVVKGQSIKRSSRRVLFTFRKARKGPCRCEFNQCCDHTEDQMHTGAAHHWKLLNAADMAILVFQLTAQTNQKMQNIHRGEQLKGFQCRWHYTHCWHLQKFSIHHSVLPPNVKTQYSGVEGLLEEVKWHERKPK